MPSKNDFQKDVESTVCECTDWSESLLVTQVLLLVLSCTGSFILFFLSLSFSLTVVSQPIFDDYRSTLLHTAFHYHLSIVFIYMYVWLNNVEKGCKTPNHHHCSGSTLFATEPELLILWGWLGEGKVSCILHHLSVQLILAYSWARPAILVAGKGRGECFYFFCFFTFIHFPLSSLSLSFISTTISSISLLPFSGRWHKMAHKVDVSLNPNTINF